MSNQDTEKVLPWFVLLYTLASLIHFTHNAEFLSAYPNLPPWISRASVYIAWTAIAAIGLLGYALLRIRLRVPALIVLATYACLGFDGLLHYQRAPFGDHTVAMNATILFESVTAALLLAAVLRSALRFFRPRAA